MGILSLVLFCLQLICVASKTSIKNLTGGAASAEWQATKQVVELIKQIAATETTSKFDAAHPVSTVGKKANFDTLNLRHKHIIGTMKKSKIKKYLQDILARYGLLSGADQLEESPWDDIDRYTESHFFYAMPVGGASSVHFAAYPLNKDQAKVGIWIDSADFKLGKERLVVHRSKKKWLSSKSWDEIIYLDPQFTSDDMNAFIVHTMREFAQFHSRLEEQLVIEYTPAMITQGVETAEAEECTTQLRSWLENEVKLPQYIDMFVNEGFDNLQLI
eukprot:CAMPEP_0202703438 /NCGR_PEP_ID=MMETSP1385-20130828/16285_1 /ASSEMBLY_ACC=CAM_ASM_000861 /TAXON_ID=933848 /ORGANISM="Elphidium margaritaceum" /LENGTH=273 /DNA_ID=CAMNT_0049361291 /DNA_START=36 /DNA_END=854 /DNA_ORIENTATION=+